jgi:hypothetical protein
MFQIKGVEKIKTHFVFSNFLFQKNVQKCGRGEQTTDDNMAHEHSMPDA